jgi:hypothetical protein
MIAITPHDRIATPRRRRRHAALSPQRPTATYALSHLSTQGQGFNSPRLHYIVFNVLWNPIWLNKTTGKTISEKVRHFPALTFREFRSPERPQLYSVSTRCEIARLPRRELRPIGFPTYQSRRKNRRTAKQLASPGSKSSQHFRPSSAWASKASFGNDSICCGSEIDRGWPSRSQSRRTRIGRQLENAAQLARVMANLNDYLSRFVISRSPVRIRVLAWLNTNELR